MHLEYTFMNFPARHLAEIYLQFDFYNTFDIFLITVTPVCVAQR